MENKNGCGCPVRTAIEMIGGKWKLPIIWEVSQRKNPRYNELKRALDGITNTMLAKSLKELEHDGILQRIQFNEIPPHVEYRLTERAQGLIAIIEDLSEWTLAGYAEKAG